MCFQSKSDIHFHRWDSPPVRIEGAFEAAEIGAKATAPAPQLADMGMAAVRTGRTPNQNVLSCYHQQTPEEC
jgi:hypothetical protein